MPAESVMNVEEIAPTKSALSTLRERTRDLHTQLENAVDITSRLGSLPSYIHLLRGYLKIYTPFEAALEAQPASVRQIVSQFYQGRVPSLERDLRALAADPSLDEAHSHHVILPSLGDLDSVLGALYVVEGSNLGGQIIYREIQQRLGIDADSGASFFFGNGEQTGPAWKRLTALLNERISHPEQAAIAAVAMFTAFESALSSGRG